MSHRAASTPRDGGAALLSVLMLVAAMSVAALIAVEAIARATDLARLTRDRGEAHWITVSAETVGVAVVEDILAKTQGRLSEATPGLDEPFRFSVDRGVVTLRVREASNCFNLNALAEPGERGWNIVESELAAYKRLFIALGFGTYETDLYGDSLADWIDSDSLSRGNGAEDAYYGDLAVPYRTASTPLENVRELRAIGPYTPEIIALLEPLVCVRPNFEQSKLNLNTLTERQAPLLTALVSEDLSPESALDLMSRRPATGWFTTEAFLQEPELTVLASESLRIGTISVETTHFLVEGRVNISGLEIPFEYLYGPGEQSAVQLLWRRKGED